VAALDRSISSQLRPLVDRQWGAVSRAQLLALGVASGTIDAWLATGRLRPLHRGVYAYGHAALRPEGRWMAAVLACGEDAALCGRSAAAALGVLPYDSATVHVVTPRKLRRNGPIHPHRARSLDARDVTSIQGIPTTTVPRTALDLAGTEPKHRVERFLANADRQQLYDQRALQSVVERNRTHRGATPLASLIAAVPKLTRSDLEAILLEAARGEGVEPPISDHTIHLPHRGPTTVDFYFPAERLVIEIDSWTHHRSRTAFEDDRARDLELVAHGERVVRLTDRQERRRAMGLVRRAVTGRSTTATTSPRRRAASAGPPAARRRRGGSR
jgi:hypothetical protein